MSTKDLFDKNNKILTKSDSDKIKKEVESFEFIRDEVESRKKIRPRLDYSKPENFAKYGSSVKYYEDAFARVYKTYPYDGSASEIKKWMNESSDLDLWVFESAYPRFSGHVKLSSSQYIHAVGGPNKQPGVVEGDPEELSKQYPSKQGNSNIWDPAIYRNSNIYINGDLGNTVEFWAKFDAQTLNSIFQPFTIGNEQGDRIYVRYGPQNGGETQLFYKDDTLNGLIKTLSTPGLFETSWSHYAFSFKNTDTAVEVRIYKNGQLAYSATDGTPLSPCSEVATYLRINGNTNSDFLADGIYLDEFRFWKTVRTEQQVGRYWFTNIHGGTNTDNNKYGETFSNIDIGIYYKFNEGVQGREDLDSVVLDYSGRITNGTIFAYTNTTRSTLSAIDESTVTDEVEFKDPVLYPQHPDYISSKDFYVNEARIHDLSNNASIYHTLPGWITDEDAVKGENIKELTQVISSFFDDFHLKTQHVPNLAVKDYFSLSSDVDKPSYLAKIGIKSLGFSAPDIFTEATLIEDIMSRSEQYTFEEKLEDIKNVIYQNIYNNLNYIYKSKGTEKSFRNLIRCFGIDDEIVKINMYANNTDYALTDQSSKNPRAIKKNFVDFNHPTRDQGFVESTQDASNQGTTQSHIVGAKNNWRNIASTFETEVIFPKPVKIENPSYFELTNLVENIAFVGKYDSGYLQEEFLSIKAVKTPSITLAKDIKFVCTFDGVDYETEVFKDVYDNSKFNVAVKIKPSAEIPLPTNAQTIPYTLEFYCVRTLSDSIEQEDTVTAEIQYDGNMISCDKYIRLGKTLNDVEKSHKVSSTLFWYDFLSNEEIQLHAFDTSNYGRLNPTERIYTHLFDDTVTRADTLALHWDFNRVATTDANGQFVVDDLSAGESVNSQPYNNYAIEFDDVDDFVEIQNAVGTSFVTTDAQNNPAFDTPFSVSAWINVPAGEQGTIIGKYNANVESEWLFWVDNGQVRVNLYDFNNAGNTGNRIRCQTNEAGGALTPDTWHHVVMVYDGFGFQGVGGADTGITIFVDGQQPAQFRDGQNYACMAITNSQLVIGSTENGALDFQTKIADIAIFNKDLDATAVQDLYNDGKVWDLNNFYEYDSIVSWWKMGDGDTAPVIQDSVGDNDGTLSGDASIVTEINLPSDSIFSGRLGWFTSLVSSQTSGLGQDFNPDDNQVTNREFIYSAKYRTPGVIGSEDLVEIGRDDYEVFTRNTKPAFHYFAIEKSMYQVVDEDILNLFSSILEFNNLIGQPVNRYRMQYKSMNHFRQKYFETVKNIPSLEKYVDYYKWIDTSIGLMIRDLMPASSDFAADLRTMVESHVLERNKYWTKFPTLEMKQDPPEGQTRGIGELSYDWNLGHAPPVKKSVNFKAISFDGNLDGIEVPNHEDFVFTTDKDPNEQNPSDLPFSISTWVNIDDPASDHGPFMAKLDFDLDENGVRANEWYFKHLNGEVQFFVYDVLLNNSGNAISRRSNVANLQANTWHHVVCTYDGSANPNGIHLYVDGQSIDQNTSVFPDAGYVCMRHTTANVVLGASFDAIAIANANRNYEGKLADSAVFNKELSVQEVVEIYNGGVPNDMASFSDVSSVVAWWKMGDDTDSPGEGGIKDYINSHNGTLVGDASIVDELGLLPPDSDLSANCLWAKERLNRSDYRYRPQDGVDGSESVVATNREAIRKISVRDVIGLSKVEEREGEYVEESKPLLRTPNNVTYEGSTYATRRLSKPYRLRAEKEEVIKSGVNYSEITKDPNSFIRASTKVTSGVSGIEIALGSNPQSCGEDKAKRKYKRTSNITIKNTEIGFSSSMDGSFIFPHYGDVDENGTRSANASMVNIHSDSYGDDAEVPIQSPFTNQWVGGNQHRHILHTQQQDRPELFIDDSGTLRHPHEVDAANPAARWTRDGLTKKPINTKNIKNTDGYGDALGNYSKDYQIVQTSSRTANNRHFVDNGGILPSYSSPALIEGISDTNLPERQRSEHVFVERFSAPGDPLTLSRGFLDAYAEEYSVYNSTNYRNYEERVDYAKRLTASSKKYSGSPGYEDTINGIASVHKVNPNRNNLPSGGTQFDNAYIGNQIPRSDNQYFANYHSNPDSLTEFSAYSQPVVFEKGYVSGSLNYADYQAAGWRFVRNVEKSHVANQRRNNIISILDNPSTNQIRSDKVTNHVEPAVAWHKPLMHEIFTAGEVLFQTEINLLRSQDRMFNDAELMAAFNWGNTRVSHSYSSNLEMFANPNLANRLSAKNATRQYYDQLLDDIIDGEIFYRKLVSTEIIYPKRRNVGLSKVRNLPFFDSYKIFWRDKLSERIKKNATSETKLGFKINNTFRRRFNQSYSIDVVDNFGYRQSPPSADFNGEDSHIIIEDSPILSFPHLGDLGGDGTNNSQPFSISFWAKFDEDTSGISTLLRKHHEYYININPAVDFIQFTLEGRNSFNPSALSSMSINFSTANATLTEWNHFLFTYEGDQFNAQNDNTVHMYLNGVEQVQTNPGQGYSGIMADTDAPLVIGSGWTPSANTEFHTEIELHDVALFKKALSLTEASNVYNLGGDLTGLTDVVGWWRLAGDSKDLSSYNNNGVSNNVTYTHSKFRVIGDLAYMGEKRERYSITNKGHTPRGKVADEMLFDYQNSLTANTGLEEIASIVEPLEPLYPAVVIEREAPVPTVQLNYSNPQEPLGWISRKQKLSQETPTQIYNKYSEVGRLAGQNYAVLSEFCISEHMDRYVKDFGGNFHAKNYQFLSLKGASYDGISETTSSGTPTNSGTAYSRVKDSSHSEDLIHRYPTSPLSEGFWNCAPTTVGRNEVYSPSPSTYDISNSINNDFAIDVSNEAVPFSPIISGINASGKFNLELSDNDFLLVDIDKVVNDGQDTGLAISSLVTLQGEVIGDPTTPMSFSIWVQPETVEGDTQSNYGIMSIGSMAESDTPTISDIDKAHISLFSKYNYSPATAAGRDDLGLTLVVGYGEEIGFTEFESSPGAGDSEDVAFAYAFFNKDGTIARLQEGVFNHVVMQIVPAKHPAVGFPLFVRCWLNNEEVYGSNVLDIDATDQDITANLLTPPAYSPLPVGSYVGVNPTTQQPFHNLEGDAVQFPGAASSSSVSALTGLWGNMMLNKVVLGNGNFYNTIIESLATDAVPGTYTYDRKFRGLIDEFCMIQGIMLSENVSSLYNQGKPGNVQEILSSFQQVSNSNLKEYDYMTSQIQVESSNSSFFYSEDFSEYDQGEFNSDDFTRFDEMEATSGIDVQENSSIGNDQRIVRIGGLGVDHASVASPPISSGDYRWFELNTEITEPAVLSFNAYEGWGSDNGSNGQGLGEWGMGNSPEPADNEHLWVQYSHDDGATWTTSGSPLEAGGAFWNSGLDTNYFGERVTFDIPVDVAAGQVAKVRWLTRRDPNANNAADTYPYYDVWGVSNIVISSPNVPVGIDMGTSASMGFALDDNQGESGTDGKNWLVFNGVGGNVIDDPPAAIQFPSQHKWLVVETIAATDFDETITASPIIGEVTISYTVSWDRGFGHEPDYNAAGNKEEDMWLQYKVKDGTWTTIQSHTSDPFQLQPGATRLVTKRINPVTDNYSDTEELFFRWVVLNNNLNPNQTTTPDWAITDVSIRSNSQIMVANNAPQGYMPVPSPLRIEDSWNIETDLDYLTPNLLAWHRIGVPEYDTIRCYTWDDQFFNSYVHTNNMPFIEETTRKQEETGVGRFEKKVNIKVSAMKKLLPYDGFYPQDRTVQIAKLFLEKIENTESFVEDYHLDVIYRNQSIQAIMQHFFAPGILYNTLKSGVACDWASYTNDSGLEPCHSLDSIPLDNSNFTPFAVPNTSSPVIYRTKGRLHTIYPAPSWYLGSTDNLVVNGLQTTLGFDKSSFEAAWDNSYPTYHIFEEDTPEVAEVLYNGYIRDPVDTNPALGFLASSPLGKYNGVFSTSAYTTNHVLAAFKGSLLTTVPSRRLPFEALLDPIGHMTGEIEEDIVLDTFNIMTLFAAAFGGDAQAIAAYKSDITIKTGKNKFFLINPDSYRNSSNVISLGLGYSGGLARYSKTNLPDPNAPSGLAPSGYAWTGVNNNKHNVYNYPYFDANNIDRASDQRYEMAMHNFLAEIPRFFLKNETLNVFKSNKESSFIKMYENTTYYLDIVMSKTKGGFSPVYSSTGMGGDYFGPPMMWKESIESSDDIYADAAHAAYVPPYLYGDSMVRLKFTPDDGDRIYTISEIFASIEQEQYSQAGNLFQRELRNSNSSQDYQQSPAWQSRMPLASSVSMFERTTDKQVSYDVFGNPVELRDADNSNNDSWVIYPKFECPILNFLSNPNDSSKSSIETKGYIDVTEEIGTTNYKYSFSSVDAEMAASEDTITGSGLWAGYGSQTANQGVFLKIEQGPTPGQVIGGTDEAPQYAGSLLDICGFTPESRQLGVLADTKEITEAVVMIPFLDEKKTEVLIQPEITIDRRPEIRQDVTIQVDDRHFIKVSEAEFETQLARYKTGLSVDNPSYENDSGMAGADGKIITSSMTRTIDAMHKYNIPPKYDFLTNGGKPFVMYIVEFSHTLDKEDLENIWQGLPPKIAKTTVSDEQEITHPINSHEFFGNLNEMPKNLRWMTFKVKRKASQSYYELTASSYDDERFKFNFSSRGNVKPEYSYNYPYDFFTMLDRVKIETTSEVIGNPIDQFRKKFPTGEIDDNVL